MLDCRCLVSHQWEDCYSLRLPWTKLNQFVCVFLEICPVTSRGRLAIISQNSETLRERSREANREADSYYFFKEINSIYANKQHLMNQRWIKSKKLSAFPRGLVKLNKWQPPAVIIDCITYSLFHPVLAPTNVAVLNTGATMPLLGLGSLTK